MMLRSLVEVYQNFEKHNASIFRFEELKKQAPKRYVKFFPESGGSTFLRNVGKLVADYAGSRPRM
jgi:hypothetical protein